VNVADRARSLISRFHVRRDVDDLAAALANLAARVNSIEDHHVVVAADIVDRVRTAREATDG